jgi:predicted Rossmann fold nucleotide-binding protein DprA/Smf involved in DNA uptake
MSHYGTYLPGGVSCPGVERTAPRPMDRPPADGRMQRACLAALAQPGTVHDVSRRLGWTFDRAHSWVHYLERRGLVARVGWVRTIIRNGAGGKRAGQYQAVTS